MKTSIAAATLLCCSAAATAQSSVTMFGVLDAGVSYYTTKSSFYNNTSQPVAPPQTPPAGARRSQTVLSNSGTSNSRLGFRGVEDLGGGWAAGFWLEAALANDAGGATFFSRRSTVSLSGPVGEIRLGRDFTPTFWNDSLFSPFSTIGVGANVISSVGTSLAVARGPGSATAASDNYLRTNNSIGYFLPPNLGGIYGQLQYALHENFSQSGQAGNLSHKGQFASGRLGYAAGAFDIALAYGESVAADTTGLGATGQPNGVNLDEKLKTLNLGASYNLGFMKLFGELSRVKDQRASTAPGATGPLLTRDDDKYNGGLIGVTVPMGAGLIKAAYSKVKYDNDLGTAAGPSRDASVDKIAVGYEYNLSKRTAVYATAALVRAKNAQNNSAVMGVATGSTTYLSTGAGTTGYAPARSTGYDVGIRHAF